MAEAVPAALPDDLTVLQTVKDWIYGNAASNSQPTAGDAILQRLISQASRTVLSYLQRGSLLPRTLTEIRSGVGGLTMMLRSYPVLTVVSVTVTGVSIPLRPPYGSSSPQVVNTVTPWGPSGFSYEMWDGTPPGKPQSVAIDGYTGFRRGQNNVTVQYTTGYQVSAEPGTIAAGSVAIQQPYGRYSKNVTVVYAATGVALTPVLSAPTAGQYVAPLASAPQPLAYTFNAADDGQAVLLTYGFVPADLDYATAKWVGDWWNLKGHPREKSLALTGGAGTTSYDLSAMPDDVKLIVQPYRRLIPTF